MFIPAVVHDILDDAAHVRGPVDRQQQFFHLILLCGKARSRQTIRIAFHQIYHVVIQIQYEEKDRKSTTREFRNADVQNGFRDACRVPLPVAALPPLQEEASRREGDRVQYLLMLQIKGYPRRGDGRRAGGAPAGEAPWCGVADLRCEAAVWYGAT